MKVFELFNMFVLGCSIMTGLITQAIKVQLGSEAEKVSSNVLAGLVSVIIGLAVCCAHAILHEVAIDASYIVFTITVVVFSWLCAMLGYDKVMQTISQKEE